MEARMQSTRGQLVSVNVGLAREFAYKNISTFFVAGL